MKLFTKISMLFLVLTLSTAIVYAQSSPIPGLTPEKSSAEIAQFEQLHGPTVIVPPAQEGSKAVGDDCSSPIVVSLGIGDSYSESAATTCGRGNTYADTDLGYYDGGEDIIYEIEITESAMIDIHITNTGTSWAGMGLFDACPDAGNMLASDTYATGNELQASGALMAGTYYLMVDTWPTPDCITFDLDITATAVATGDACFAPYDFGNVNDPAVDAATSQAGDADWYMVTSQSDLMTTVSLCGSSFDTKLEVWTDCGTMFDENDDYCSTQSQIDNIPVLAGESIYIKVFGYSAEFGDYTLDITGVDMTPKMDVAPNPLSLGEWPIGGWQEMAYLTLTNDGFLDIEVTDSDLDDDNGVFALNNPAFTEPIPPAGTEMVGVSFVGDGVAAGTYEATYVASFGLAKAVATADLTVDAYDAPVGDIVENPFMVAALPYSDAGVSSGFPMRSNYNIPGTATNGKDVVYMFTLDEDKEVDVTISNATETPKMAIYAAGFEGEGGPMVGNAIASAGDIATDVPLFAGDYYLVVAAEDDNVAMTFDIDIDATTMPDPECVINPNPADAAMDIPSNGIVLSWDYGQYVQEYQVMFGTDYPPSEELVPWTAAGEFSDSYALPNLEPSMQYFWQVNVRNNNATVTCDIFGFTTTITPPADLTASVVTNAQDDYDVQLNWTSSAKALLGYNVYRSDDGVTYNMINTDLVPTNSYLDEGLAYNMDPCYTYYVEAIFDEGVSDPSNEASACITGVGTLNGTVTELLTGDPIFDALITIDGPAYYEIHTDGVGFYELEVLEGCYTITASAEGYITEVVENVCVDYNTTVTQDFELDEFPYPVEGDVIATELDENTVFVDWSGAGGGNETEFRYDDGFFTGQLGFTGGTTTSVLGAVHQVDAQLTEMSWFLTSEGGPHNTITIYVMGLDGSGMPDGTNVIFSESVTNTDLQWNTFTFDTPLDITGGFYLAVGFNGFVGLGTDDGVGDPYEYVNGTHYYSGDYTGGAFTAWEASGFPNNGMIRAMGVEGGKASYAAEPVSSKPARYSNFNLIANNEAVYSGAPDWKTKTTTTDKDLMGYNIYRGSCYSEDDFQFLGYTLDDQFTDNNWGIVDYGVYRWAVEAVYTNNVSERVYSNCLDKDMEAIVNVEVTTNSGDAPEGCNILFTNTSEPDMELTYELDLDATGMATIDPFRKGTYDYIVTLPGFADITGTAVLVDSDTTFVWQLEELLAPPSDLYVTPTGFATWTGGGVIPFEPFFENFDTQEQFDMWEVVVGGSTSDSWFWTASDAGNTLDGTPFAFVDSDAAGIGSTMDELLISPVIDASTASELYIEFDQYYNNLSASELADVEVFDGTDWVNVLHQNSDQGSWASPSHITIDVSDYANADFRLRFHYLAPGWDWYWAVDNVSVTDEMGKYSDKGFQFYKVWHDGVFVVDSDTNFYQYGENGEELVPGTTYLAEVASLYSTGLSAKAEYEWTYLPCDSFPSWSTFEAYHVDGSDDNVVSWSDNVFFTPIEEDFEGGALPEGWTMSTNSSIGWFFTTDGSSGFWSIPPGDGTYACANDDAANDDGSVDYLITPEMNFVGLSDITLTFSSFFTGDYSQTATIEVSMDAGDTWEVVENVSAAASWTEVTVDLSAYAGEASIWLAFHANDNGAWASGWAVDNVSIAPSKAGKANSIVKGTNIYRDGEMIAFVPEPDTFYLDMNLMPGYYDYCVTKVYGEEEDDNEMHWWTSCPDATCILDVLVPEDCLAPENLVATDELNDGYTATLNWDMGSLPIQEFRYDDGTSTGQLGFTGGTTTSVLGAVHQVDAELTEMSWYLTAEGGPHTNVTIYVMGLDGSGMPDGSNVLFSQSVSNTDLTWNTFTFDSPIDATGGFYLAVGYNGFVGLGTDDGVGDPYGYINGTHYYSGDYTGGAFTAFEASGFPNNGMIRAMGVPAGVPSYPVNVDNGTPDENFVYVASENPVETVEPSWTTNESSDKEFLSFNVYRADEEAGPFELIATDVTETTYLDEVGVAGYFCYYVTALYSVCGESDASNIDCVDVGVGINELANNISVYPNPAKDFVMVEASQDIRSIKVTNYMGQVVNAVKAVEMTQYRINTSDLSSGVYFVEVETAAGIEKVRIVISE